MKCPVCGSDMEQGEMQAYSRGRIFWAPKKFFTDRVFANVFLRSTIERGGGMIVRIRNRMLNSPTVGYACKKCGVVLIECEKPRAAEKEAQP